MTGTSATAAAASSRAEAPLTPLVPPPAWLTDLVGQPVQRAVARVLEAALRLHVETADGASRVFELHRRDGTSLACFEVSRGPSGLTRRPVPRFVAMTPAERAGLHHHMARIRWSCTQQLGAAHRVGYPATPSEERLARVCGALGAVRNPEAAAQLAVAPDDAADPALDGVDLAVDIMAGRWGEVFRRLDADARDLPAWLAPIAYGVVGDQRRLQALAADLTSDEGQGALAIAAAVAFKQLGFVDAALARYRDGLGALLGFERADVCLELSDLHRLRGDADDAVAWARAALLSRPEDDDLLRRVCDRLVRSGAVDDAYLALRDRCSREPLDRRAALDLARLLLWAGRPAQARPLLARVGALASDDPAALRLEGALLALEGRWDPAAEVFQRARAADPRDRESVTWLAEIFFRRGDPVQAQRYLDQARAVAQHAIHVVLTTALNGDDNRVEKDTHLGPLLEQLGEPMGPWSEHEDDVSEVATALLDTFGGNRGEHLTRLRPGPPRDGSLGLVTVPPPPADRTLVSRDAASDVIKRLGTAPVEALERDFERLAAEFPDSPHPHCYWGELNLWLGRYERSLALFEAAFERFPARWSFVGRAAVHIMQRDFERADLRLAECAHVYPPVVGATTHVYVGEMARLRGDLPAALEHLTEAVRCKPGRSGAWMNLALTHLALGQRDEAERIYHQLEARHPRLYWDAWLALTGEPRWPIPAGHLPELFETALEMMRGNRSSHTISYFDRHGVMRLAQDGQAWRGQLAKHACFVAMGLRHRLARGLGD